MNPIPKIKKELHEYKRILIISKKPTMQEFLSIAKICAIGMALIGFAGFLIQIIGIFL
ncbi:MAG: protein translocase SEC61 complex subunit gamma [Candidatus Nanoarchaeia archaeon]|nr:protein translocase SEC61 complex subunit gamma [Candidatus Nanoarchaeia archaeon]MDD5054560.1 protein translocase SEC61 complex subunit gamma [Candidatus Nanoarchaeia archaeon]MDD5499430.1 protein translocase SEC61 complex subunit gamma [Candidatus Nanoarchaeia archaeon]